MTEIVKSTMMIVYLMLLLSFMINQMTTRAAVFALHVPVMKGGTTACFFHETCIVSVGGQQLSTNDDLLLRTWDVWLGKKPRKASEIDYMGIENNTARYRNLDISRRQSRRNLVYPKNEDKMLSGTYSELQAAMAPSNIAVQWQHIQHENVEYSQSEGFYRHAASDRRREEQKEDEKDGDKEKFISRVPQRTARPMATVQLTVFKSEAEYFDAEVPVRNAGSGVHLDSFFLQWSVPWDVGLIAEEKRQVDAMTVEEYQSKPTATPRATTIIDSREIHFELHNHECLPIHR